MEYTTLQSNLYAMLADLSDEERDALVLQLGEMILETAILRGISELSEEQSVALEYYLRTEPTPEDLIQYLVQKCKGFAAIFDEEVAAVQKDMAGVLTAA